MTSKLIQLRAKIGTKEIRADESLQSEQPREEHIQIRTEEQYRTDQLRVSRLDQFRETEQNQLKENRSAANRSDDEEAQRSKLEHSELNFLHLSFFRNVKDPLEDFDYNDPRCNPLYDPQPQELLATPLHTNPQAACV
ncbi:conserved oligomeric Golgi complex subunit 3-like [Dorcoceras hygrometricum]|uniref:Conserved oligomeric Golgi complex subunit 3-like n=1 Tax=Dorcoceras hygrometricum TaxID=472368 RepID=A0A2Z7BYX6_9LAMI|nr:conserved oligomeric Golgi complex subunit 3-like [Dorcoceras hygrometricum]